MSLVTLPTTFTPSSSCLASSNVWDIITTITFCSTPCHYFLQGPPSTSDCLPLSYQESPSTFYLPGGQGCPPGYSSACVSTKSLGAYTVSLSICCPSNFQCQSSPSLLWQTTLGCFSPFPQETTTMTVIASQTGTTSTNVVTETSGGAVNAYAIAIKIPDPTTNPNATAGATSGSIPQSSGLNTTMIALICVVVFLVIAIILGFVIRKFCWGKNRRRTSAHVRLGAKPSPNSASNRTELRRFLSSVT